MIPSRLRDSAARSCNIVRRGFALLAIAFLVDAAFLFVFLIALQSYIPESMHGSAAIAGYALAAFGLAKLATQIGGGFISDRLGTARALALGTALLLVADVLILVLAHTAPWLIIGAAAIEGLGSSVTWPALYSAGADRFGEGDKGRFTAMLTLASGGALAVGLGGGAVLNMYVSFDAAMVGPIGAVAIALGLTLVAGRTRGAAAGRMPARLPLSEIPGVLATPQRTVFAALVLAEAVAIGALTATFRAYGRDVLDVSLAREGLLLAPAAVLGGLLVIPGGAMADRVGGRLTMALGFGLTGACLLLLARLDDPLLVAAVGALAGGAFGFAMPAIAATMIGLSRSAGVQGGLIGWFMTMDGFGHAAGPALAGLLLGISGAPAVLVLSGGLFLLVAYAATLIRVDAVHPATAISAAAQPPVAVREASR